MADRKAIEKCVVKSVEKAYETTGVTLDTLFKEDLHSSSIKTMKVAMFIEDEFDIEINLALLKNNVSVKDTCDVVEGIINGD